MAANLVQGLQDGDKSKETRYSLGTQATPSAICRNSNVVFIISATIVNVEVFRDYLYELIKLSEQGNVEVMRLKDLAVSAANLIHVPEIDIEYRV